MTIDIDLNVIFEIIERCMLDDLLDNEILGNNRIVCENIRNDCKIDEKIERKKLNNSANNAYTPLNSSYLKEKILNKQQTI